jgi:aminopeptidase N
VLTALGVTARDPSSTNPVEAFISAAAASLRAVGDPDTTEDLALIAYTLTLPSENLLSEAVKAHHTAVDPTAVHEAREQLRGAIASRSADALQQCYRAHRTDYALPFERSTRAVGARQLCELVLQYLCTSTGDRAAATATLCAEQLSAANNM